MVFVGYYLVLYGIWSVQVLDFTTEPIGWINAIVTTAEGWQASLQNWMSGTINLFGRTMARTSVMGWTFAFINVAIAIAGFVERQTRNRFEPATVKAVNGTSANGTKAAKKAEKVKAGR